MKKGIFYIIFLLLIVCIYIIAMNYPNTVHINYLYSKMLDAQTQAGWTDQGAYFYKELSLGIYSIITLVTGFLMGFGMVYVFLSTQNEKVKEYKKELEKTSLYGEASASRVEVLEAKIKTLEKAFNTVADERTKLEVQIKNLNDELDNINKNK